MFLVDHWQLYIRLVVALFIGAIIGYERASKNKDAGIRTHSLVCLASALIMVLSTFSEGQFRDPMRMASQVVSGIGFIGAGVIWMDKRNTKRGLTTAASLWMTSALGLTVGYGLFDISILTLLLIFVSLNLPKILKKIGLLHKNHTEDIDD